MVVAAAEVMSWKKMSDLKTIQTCLDWRMGHSEATQSMRIGLVEEVEEGGKTVGMVVVVEWC